MPDFLYFYFMKLTGILLFFLGMNVLAQTSDFPESWEGNWKGELTIYNSKSVEPSMKIPMELEIQPKNDSVWKWEIRYMTEKPDVRSYELIKDAKANSWKIDEKNGIILPQTFLENRMVSSFSLEKILLIASYWLENNRMNFEIIITNSEPETSTGLGNEDSPIVGNHKLNGYHRAVLTKE